MNLFSLSLAYLRRRPWGTLLNVTLLALGIAIIVVLLLFSHQVERSLTSNAEGIDLVVGAKGSPLQLILSAVYHVDSPTGNIPVTEADQLVQNPAIASAIPLALGDSYRGYRIVGSTRAYLDHYEATVASGDTWGGIGQVVLGAAVAAETGLELDAEIVSAHGLSEGGVAHDKTPLRVVGTLAPTGTVLDRLILTSVETVWAVHGDHAAGEHDDDHDHGDDHGHDGDHGHEGEHTDAHGEHEDGHHGHGDDHHDDESPPTVTASLPSARLAPAQATPPSLPPTAGSPPIGAAPPGTAPPPPPSAGGAPERQYTALLLSFASPMAAVAFPRMVNAQTNLQAAAPAVETQRLLSLLGIGIDALRLFGLILIAAAALGVGIALYNALRERRYDLAVMRSLGARRRTLVGHVLLEGLLLASLGALLGLGLGHVAASALGAATAGTRTPIPLTGATFLPEELALVGLVLVIGLVAALVPAIQAYRTDIARLLARG